MADSVQAGNLVGQRLGKYDLLALLAIGGTAEIYLARIGGEAGFEKYVVVKCLLDHLADDAEFVRMFLDEARLGAQLDHSNIVQTLELGEQDGRYFMVMEYLAGMSLAQLARKTQERVPGGLMPIDLVLGLAAQACAGLHYAHERCTASGKPLNIVHRDISPQNLVVSFDGVLKIVDFGIAKADVRQTHTRSGTIKGKFAYMSPEQCLAKEIDRRTDIFALGVIIHELLTARRLFKRSTTYETYQTIVNGKVPTPSSVNNKLTSELDDLVMKALRYNKEERYENAQGFGESMLGVLHRRGRSISASDVARYYEEHFEIELGEHADRMRALIAGRKKTNAEDDLTWDSAEKEREEAQLEVELEVEHVEVSDSEALIDTRIREPSHTDVEDVDSNDELEGEATRIELNPLENIEKDSPPRQQRSQSTMDTNIEGAAPGVGELTAPTRQVTPEGDRPTVALNKNKDPLARVPNFGVPKGHKIPTPAGKTGKKPTMPPVGGAAARKPGIGGLSAPGRPTLPSVGGKVPGKIGGPSSTPEEPTRANRNPDRADAAGAPAAGQGPKQTLFAPGGAPVYKPKAPGPDRPTDVDDESPTIVPGEGPAPVAAVRPASAQGPSASAATRPTLLEGEPPSNGAGAKRRPFGPPPSLTTNSGDAQARGPSERPVSVPPDTLPGDEDAPTAAQTNPHAHPVPDTAAATGPRPNTPLPAAHMGSNPNETPVPAKHGGPTPVQIGGAPPRTGPEQALPLGAPPPTGRLAPLPTSDPGTSGSKFPLIETPSAFKPAPRPLRTPPGMPVAGSDLGMLAAEKHPPAIWLIAAVFFASATVGMLITLLLAKLF